MDVWRFTDPTWSHLDLRGFAVEAVDRRLGTVASAAADRVVVAGGSRSILLPAGVVEQVDTESRRVDVYRSSREIDAAPIEDEEAIGAHYAPWGPGGRVLPCERSRQLLVHIAQRDEWARAIELGVYRPGSLDEIGFVHASTAYSLELPANLFYRGRRDLVLLCIDQRRLAAEVLWEEPEPTVEAFPHVYGAVDVDAVVCAVDFQPRADGTFEVPPDVRALADACAAATTRGSST